MIDFHVHSTFSDGEKDVRSIIDLAVQRGITDLAITDHFDPFDETLSNRDKGLEALLEHFEEIREYSEWTNKTSCIRVLCGIETCTGMDGRLRLPEGCQEACDIIITSPHYVEGTYPFEKGKYNLDAYWGQYKEKLLAMASGEGDVLGHPMGYLPIKPMLGEDTTFGSRQEICREICRRYFDREFVGELGDRLCRSGKACELHGATGTPEEWIVQSLHEQGVTFSIGSDAHAMDLLGKNERAEALAEKMGLRIWNGKRK